MKSDHFEIFLQRLDADRERAGEKYEQLRRRLLKFFEWNSCFPAEDRVDETFDRVAERLTDVQVLDLVGFAWGVAKHIRQEANKRSERTVPISDLPRVADIPAAGKNPEKAIQEGIEDERRARCLHLSLHRFPTPDREVFLKYHDVRGERTEYRLRFAHELGVTIGALRVRINRLREKLEKCLCTCMAAHRTNERS